MELTVVTYHYVRDPEKSGYPAIKARRLSEFRAQLDFIQDNYVTVRAEQVVAAIAGDETLPAKALWLTFDDGYIDHYDNVFPMLRDREMQGSFFPPARAVLARELLDVNKIHFLLACQPDPAPLIARLRTFISEHSAPGLQSFDAYWQQYAVPSRYDGPEVVFVKHVLQSGIPDDLRRECLDELFREFVSVDPLAFGSDLYASREQLQEMIDGGMYVGGHGDKHVRLNRLPSDQQLVEIDRSLAFLKDLGSPVDHWVMCYPYGANDASARDHLRRRGCAVGLTVRPAVASLGIDDPLMLPRLDTNDMPIH